MAKWQNSRSRGKIQVSRAKSANHPWQHSYITRRASEITRSRAKMHVQGGFWGGGDRVVRSNGPSWSAVWTPLKDKIHMRNTHSREKMHVPVSKNEKSHGKRRKCTFTCEKYTFESENARPGRIFGGVRDPWVEGRERVLGRLDPLKRTKFTCEIHIKGRKHTSKLE